MVQLGLALLLPRTAKGMARAQDGSWRKRQVLKLSAHFYGRARNCFSIAIRRVQKALLYVTEGRKLRKVHMRKVWKLRIDAACQELGNLPEGSVTMLEGLERSRVLINTQNLGNLAVWEPRTFEALNKIAAAKANEEKLARYLGPFPKGILGKL